MKANSNKYHLLSGNYSHKITIGNTTISSSICKKPKQFKIDNSFDFKKHIESFCEKASQKINALSRYASSIDLKKRSINEFFRIGTFLYYSVV